METEIKLLTFSNRPFISPILHPSDPNTLPAAVKALSPITGPAHPGISNLSCAVLHPDVPNCSTAFLHHLLLSAPPLARTLAIVMAVASTMKLKAVLTQPIGTINDLSKRIIRLTAVLSVSAGSAWGSLCLWNALFARSTLPTKRFYLSGALAGLPFAFITGDKNTYLSVFREALKSASMVDAKRATPRIMRGTDLWLIVTSLAVLGAILDSRPTAIEGKAMRKGLSWLKGRGYVDPVELAEAQRKAQTLKDQQE